VKPRTVMSSFMRRRNGLIAEPPRDCRRLQLLRGWSYDKENIGTIFT
jgi:hypothetical protein